MKKPHDALALEPVQPVQQERWALNTEAQSSVESSVGIPFKFKSNQDKHQRAKALRSVQAFFLAKQRGLQRTPKLQRRLHGDLGFADTVALRQEAFHTISVKGFR